MHFPVRFDFTAPPWIFDLLTHLWQSSVVGLLVLVLMVSGAGLAARTRRTLGWIAVAKFALPAAWLVRLLERTPGASTAWLATDPLILTRPLADASAAGAADVAAGLPFWPALAAIWAAGTVALLGRWTLRARRVRRQLLSAALPAPPALTPRVARAAALVGLRRIPRCALAAVGHGPGVIGVMTPVLILPRGLAEVLTPAELDAILIHECLHLRTRDNLAHAVGALFVSLLWFNPIAWLLHRRIRLETEMFCDERVLQHTEDARAYASSIVGAVRHALGLAPRPGFSGATTPPVVGRIKAILAYPNRRERPVARWITLSASFAMVAFSGLAGSIAAETKPNAPVDPGPPAVGGAAAPAPAPSDRTTPPRYKVGNVSIKFNGPSPVNEAAVRDLMQIRAGGEFDETSLDRDIRAIYGMGKFKSVEAKHEAVDATTINLVFELTPEPKTASATPVPLDPSSPGPTPGEFKTSELTPAELADARRKLVAAEGRLKQLRDARAAGLEPSTGTPQPAGSGRPLVSFDTIVLPKLVPPIGLRDGWETRDPRSRAVAEASVVRDDETPERLAVKRRIAAADQAAEEAAKAAEAARNAADPLGPRTLTTSTRIFEIDALDRKPAARFQSRPQYPFEMRRAGIGGEVVVEFIIDPNGDVENAFAVRSSRREFEGAAVQAVSRWRFRPGMKDGVNVSTRMQVPIVFTLSE